MTDAKGAVAYVQNIKVAGGDSWCLSSGAASTSSTAQTAASTWSEQAWSDSASATWSPEATTAGESTKTRIWKKLMK